MSCSRCGQKHTVHGTGVSTPSGVVSRPGGIVIPAAPRPAVPAPTGLPSNVIKQSITGLRYVPNR